MTGARQWGRDPEIRFHLASVVSIAGEEGTIPRSIPISFGASTGFAHHGCACAQLDLFLEDGNQAMTVAVIRAIAAAVPHCPSTSFLEWSADKVYTLAKANTQSSLLQFGEAGLARRKECAAALFDAVQVRPTILCWVTMYCGWRGGRVGSRIMSC